MAASHGLSGTGREVWQRLFPPEMPIGFAALLQRWIVDPQPPLDQGLGAPLGYYRDVDLSCHERPYA
jgi:hypothetical protein